MGSFIVRNTFRNKRRSLLTMVSISFSLLLLTMMICIWRSFYVDQVAPEAARRLVVRDRVSLAFFLPAYYRAKIRAVQGINAIAPITWFGGRYIDDRPEHFFAQLATDPEEYLKNRSKRGSMTARDALWMSRSRTSMDGRLGTGSHCSGTFSRLI